MFNWLTFSLYLIILTNFDVDGRFRRLLPGSSSIESAHSTGRWRLMSPNDIIQSYPISKLDNSQRYFIYHDDLLTDKRNPDEPLRQPLINQRHPIMFGNHQRLPISFNHYRINNHVNSKSGEYQLESGNNHLKSNEHSRTNEAIFDSEKNEKPEKLVEIVKTSTESSNIGQPDDPKTKSLEKSKETISSSSPSSSSSSFEIHRVNFMKKATLESIEGPLLSNYRSLNQQNFNKPESSSFSDLYFVAIVVGSSGIAIFAVIGAGYCFYRFQQHNKSAGDVDYPAYGVVGPITKETTNSGNISPIGDRKLAQSAQMYHYHHQKQQMIASEKVAASRHTSASDVDSEEENEEGDYTVYECPGLASTGEMEVKNPLFQDDITPVSSPSVINNTDSKDKK